MTTRGCRMDDPRRRSHQSLQRVCSSVSQRRIEAGGKPSEYIHCVPRRPPFYVLNNSVKNKPILMIFGVLNPEKILHVRCSHFTLENPKKVIFNGIIHTHSSDYLRYISRIKQTVIHLSTPPESVSTLTCEMLNFYIWLKVFCVPSNVGGSEKNRLWCVATGMSGKHCRSKCS